MQGNWILSGEHQVYRDIWFYSQYRLIPKKETDVWEDIQRKGRMIINASKKYRDAKDKVESELKAPRVIIGWLIGLNVIEVLISCYIIWRLR